MKVRGTSIRQKLTVKCLGYIEGNGDGTFSPGGQTRETGLQSAIYTLLLEACDKCFEICLE